MERYMKRKKAIVLLLVALILFGAASFGVCLSRKPADTSTILAEWDGGKITEQELERRLELLIESLPPFYQPKEGFSIEDKQQFLKDFAIEEIFYLEAKKEGIDTTKAAISFYKMGSKPLILMQYQKENINDKILVSDVNLKTFYEENKDQYFTTLPKAVILHIETATIDSAKLAIDELKAGSEFVDVMERYSVNDYSKGRGGKIIVTQGKKISGIGESAILDSLIFSADIDAILGPIEVEDGYHIIKVVERDMAKYKPFDEVKNEVERLYSADKEAEIRKQLIDELASKYQTNLDTFALQRLDFTKADTSSRYAQTQLIRSPFPEISFTIKDFADEIYSMPEPRKQMLTSYESRKQYLIEIMHNNLMYYDALQKGYAEHPELREQLARIKMVGALREYFKRNVAEQVAVSDEEVREVYDKEKDEKYLIRASARIYQFAFDDKATAEEVYQKALNLKSEEEFAKLSEEYSASQTRGGRLGPIYEGGTIPGIGPDSVYVSKIFSTPEGEFSDIFRNARGEYVFFKVLSYKPASYQPFERIAPTIENRLYREKQEERFAKLQEQIKEKYNLVIYPEKLEKKLPIDSLYKLAEQKMAEERYSSALRYYDQIIKYYPNGKDDYKALFMKGFIYSEYLNNPAKAQEAFEKVLAYPEGDLHESARYMMNALQGKDDVMEMISP